MSDEKHEKNQTKANSLRKLKRHSTANVHRTTKNEELSVRYEKIETIKRKNIHKDAPINLSQENESSLDGNPQIESLNNIIKEKKSQTQSDAKNIEKSVPELNFTEPNKSSNKANTPHRYKVQSSDGLDKTRAKRPLRRRNIQSNLPENLQSNVNTEKESPAQDTHSLEGINASSPIASQEKREKRNLRLKREIHAESNSTSLNTSNYKSNNHAFFSSASISNQSIRKGAWQSNHGPMQIIDFSQATKLDDKFAAYGCITICTSNGQIGTLTHLDTTDIHQVENFVRVLNNELKEHKSTSAVIISGGSSLSESKFLSEEIIKKLQKHSYTIVGKYLDHESSKPIPKKATLEKDKVLISEFNKTEIKNKLTELSFNLSLEEKKTPNV